MIINAHDLRMQNIRQAVTPVNSPIFLAPRLDIKNTLNQETFINFISCPHIYARTSACPNIEE